MHMQFTRHFAPTLVGDKPVSLWLDFGRVSDYVFRGSRGHEPKDRPDFKRFNTIKAFCVKAGLDEENFRDSSRATRKRQRSPEVMESDSQSAVPPDRAEEAQTGDRDWQVSVRGLLFWLWQVKLRGYVAKVEDTGQQARMLERVDQLLHGMVAWPLANGDKPEAFIVETLEPRCVTVLQDGVVDKAEMEASEVDSGAGSPDAGSFRTSAT